MKRNEKLDVLLARWYAGETSDSEENELRQALLAGKTGARHPRNERAADTTRKVRTAGASQNPAASVFPQRDDDHAIDAILFSGFQALAAERAPEPARRTIDPFATTAIPADTHSTHRTARRPLRRIIARAIAVAAVIAFGIVLGLQFREPYCYINGKPIYDREKALAATEYLDGLAALQVPERILDQLLKN